MKITVCDFPDEASRKEAAWKHLVQFLRAAATDVVVLPEMPFCEWKVFTSQTVDADLWQRAVNDHETMLGCFSELDAHIVLSSRPVEEAGKRLNQAFCWTKENGYQGVRSKYYLPDEADGRETTWFARGDRHFTPVRIGELTVGFQLCTELLFSEASHEIGRAGAHLIAAPRATGGHQRWPIAASLAAIMSGCFVASANRYSEDGKVFAGRSSVISPEGEVLGETDLASPYVSVEVDLEDAVRAKRTYPRNLTVP
jgi:N-carbamoylputrescine amidase